eukprot:2837070-Amphidinium_carterae.1
MGKESRNWKQQVFANAMQTIRFKWACRAERFGSKMHQNLLLDAMCIAIIVGWVYIEQQQIPKFTRQASKTSKPAKSVEYAPLRSLENVRIAAVKLKQAGTLRCCRTETVGQTSQWP